LTAAPRRSAFLDWKALLGMALGVGLLAYSLRDVALGEVFAEIRNADLLLFLASIIVAVGPVLVRAWRWRALLEPVRAGTSFGARFRATMIGFMANTVLPARIGEFARAYTLSRVEPVPMAASIGSLVVERLFDGIVVVAFLFLAMAMPGFPGTGNGTAFGGQALLVLALMTVVALAALAMVLLPKRMTALVEWLAGKFLPARFRGAVIDGLAALLTGLSSLRHPRLLARAGFWSVGVWLVNTFAFWLGFRAFGIDVPFTAALFLQSVIALAVALPSAPGFFGLWEAAARIGLHEVWGVELQKALAFAVGFHIGSFLTVTIPGLYYVWRLGLSWGEMGKGAGGAAGEGGEAGGTTPATEMTR
jgi:uncharacterized protein (TIRG00374 family)